MMGSRVDKLMEKIRSGLRDLPEEAVGLAGSGWNVIGVGRSAEHCSEAEAVIRTESPVAKVVFLTADLGSQRRIRILAENIGQALEQSGGSLDVLINNAATVASWHIVTEDGYEMQFAVNHLAPFFLTHELLPLLRRADHARVITVSSGSHYGTRVHWHDVMLRRGYHCLKAYKQSKLCNVLFTQEFNRRLGPHHGIRAYAVDPGLVDTAIGQKGTSGVVSWFWRLRRRHGRSPDEAAGTIIHLAAAPVLDDPDAAYWKDCRPHRPSCYSEREDIAARLWELSERLCGIVMPL